MFVSFLNAGCSLSSQVLQLPSSIVESPHNSATITCNHSISSYNVILWYQQSRGDSGLKLIGYVWSTQPSVEDPFKQRFNVTGDGSTKSQLHVVKLRESEDSGMYYCASSRHSDTVTFWPLQKPSIIYLHWGTAHLHLTAACHRKSLISALKPPLPVWTNTTVYCINPPPTLYPHSSVQFTVITLLLCSSAFGSWSDYSYI